MTHPFWSLLSKTIMNRIFHEKHLTYPLPTLPGLDTMSKNLACNCNPSTRKVQQPQTQILYIQCTLLMGSTAEQEVIIHWSSTDIAIEKCLPIHDHREPGPHRIPKMYVWVGHMQVQAILDKLNGGQTSIVLLRCDQSGDGIGDEIDIGRGPKEVNSVVASDVRRGIDLLVQLLQV